MSKKIDREMSGHTPIELLPCPFCAAVEIEYLAGDGKWPRVECQECGATGSRIDLSKQKVIERWNTRSHAANEAKIEAMETALEWALANCKDSDHPHYPYFSDDAWRFPYLVNNDGGSGGGVGEARFDTALDAVQDAIRRAALLSAAGETQA